MSQHYTSPYLQNKNQKIRNWAITLAGLVIIIVIIAFIINPSGQDNNTKNVIAAVNVNKIEPPKQPAKPLPAPAKPEIKQPIPAEPTVSESALQEPLESPVQEPTSEVARLMEQALVLLEGRPAKVVEARDKLNDLLRNPSITPLQTKLVKDKLAALSDQWLFSKTICPGDTLCESYTVKSGDLFSSIGSKYKVPPEILSQINSIPPQSLPADQNIKIIKGPFNVKVYLSNFTMDLFLQNTYVKTFQIGIGKSQHETPTGVWVTKVGGKMIKPRWTDPDTGKTFEGNDPNYPLGSRWIALDGIEGNAKGRTGFAIHGTNDSATIGTASSRGCIRLYNGNVILLYDLMMPGYSKVTVVQ